MAAPRKPWEGPPTNFHNSPSSFGPNVNGFIGGVPGTGGMQQFNNTGIPPPLPPRPMVRQTPFASSRFGGGGYHQPMSMSSSYYSPYSSYMNPYTAGGLGQSYGMHFNGGMQPYGADSSILRIAEDSSRNAFQSIESIVQTFGSISMMLESTLNALYSSFRAVVGVVDHFGRLKTTLSQVLSFLTIVRSLRWIFAKILYSIGVRKMDPNVERAWMSASNLDAGQSQIGDVRLKKTSNWPIVAFFAVVLGTPWLIWKLMCSVAGVTEEANKWALGEGDHYLAVAAYDFVGESEQEISFRANQQIRLAPKELQPRVRGWLLGSADGKKVGLLPANYVKIMQKGEKSTVQQPDVTTASDIAAPDCSPSVEDEFLNTNIG